ncbi:hypothetical protein RYZ27_10025 [Hyphomonas sp. FCG-A18]|uniref:hypothetical protein n=1 Tax=Hyphomonas sp. FCG-A18 TaxID=3080019 RepID=UPI002B2D0083|nr:hypothetical protein RYZ27_10025 [Hyphomonas sp. FCG-A18]
MEQEISPPKKQVNKTAIVALGLMGALFFLVGISILAASIKTTTETTAYEGILLDATGTSRIGRGFSNNTTLIISTSDGDRDEFEVKSSLKNSKSVRSGV